MNTNKTRIESMLKGTGITIGSELSTDPLHISVKNHRFYKRVFGGTLGIGESYMDDDWTCADIAQLTHHILKTDIINTVQPTLRLLLIGLQSRLFNMQSFDERAYKVIKAAYDQDINLFKAFLDPYNQYTCGLYPQGTETLEEAQQKKMELMCQKLQLTPKDTLLDIGCGWGGFAKYAAERYGCKVIGITKSKVQAAYAEDFTKGLRVKIHEIDYRDLPKLKLVFSKVLICGMIEHVGYKNYRSILQIVKNCIKPNGLFLLHTIGGNTSVTHTDPWINRYIFPNSMLPSLAQLTKGAEGLFVVEDVHNFGVYYAQTLLHWNENFQKNWESLKATNPLMYTERFKRMREYYFLTCAGSFSSRVNQLHQYVLSPNGVPGGYVRPIIH